MPRDASATRERILDAAVEEFAARGLAGGRVDRIAEAAGANKQLIYRYFTSKDLLFTAALDRVLGELVATVPLTEDDLPGYAGRVFDYHLAHPQALRMAMWRQLESPAAGPDTSEVYAAKVALMRDSTESGFAPLDLIVLVIGLSLSWLISSAGLRGAEGVDPATAGRLAEHRAAVVEAARRLCSPPA